MKRLLFIFAFLATAAWGQQTVRSTNFVATNDVKALTFTSQAAAPAGSGVIRLGNVELIAWEASPAGTDVTLTVNSAEQFVFSAAILSPIFITPALGTPASGVATNLTGTAAGLTAGNVSTNANLTGDVTSSGNAATLVGGTSPAFTTSITTPSTTFALINATATTINAFGAATTVNMGASAAMVLNFGGSTTAAQLRFLEPSASGTNYSSLESVAMAANIRYRLPPTAVAGGVWTDVAGDGVLTSVVPGGSLTSTQIGYGSAGNALTGEAAFNYTAATNTAVIGAVSLGGGGEASTIGPLVDAVDGVTPLNNINQVVATGTAYTMTASYASLDFGTTDPVLTIANAGTYAIYVDVQFNLVGATYATYDSVTVKLRRTNNTAADLTGSTFGTFIPTITTITATGPYLHVGPIKYTTAGTTDTITVQAILGSTPSVGSVTATACTITAIRAY